MVRGQKGSQAAAGYDGFAWHYERRWGATSIGFMGAYGRLVLNRLQPGAAILDLACGTGQVAAWLTGRGWKVTGIDSSAEMLAFARARAPRARFIQADARSFSLPVSFDAAISVYDSLNHVMTVEGLRKVFENVYAALVPGARFAFDLTTPESQARPWQDTLVEDDSVAVVRTSYDPTAAVFHFLATMFRRQGAEWVRSDIELTQRSYEEPVVRNELGRAGFGGIETASADRFGLRPGRTFYVASRRA